jgi:GTP-binding protein HflX
MFSTDALNERAFLVGATVRGAPELLTTDESLDELALLAETAGISVIGRATQNMKQIDPNTFIGSGKVEEIHWEIESLHADVLIFDDELSPRHQREIEKVMGENVKVIDRSTLILDIFAQHARTREGALQVELAQYEYRFPRLTRQWTHLARQAGGSSARGGAGGVGLRGPGETQLEVDRREISQKIVKLKADLEEVRAHRGRARDQRTRFGTPVVALVGYTNAGKSTLLNRLTGADVYVANQLFATLDPTTRRLELPGGKAVLISDTVGFIQKLPTTLIAAFRATLEEVTQADILIHVVDMSHHNARQQMETVELTLKEIEVPELPRILVLNKLDRFDYTQFDTAWVQGYDAIIPVSAKDGTNIEQLIAEIERILVDQMVEVELMIPYRRGDLLSKVHELGIIDEETSYEQGTHLRAHIPKRFVPHLDEVRLGENAE